MGPRGAGPPRAERRLGEQRAPGVQASLPEGHGQHSGTLGGGHETTPDTQRRCVTGVACASSSSPSPSAHFTPPVEALPTPRGTRAPSSPGSPRDPPPTWAPRRGAPPFSWPPEVPGREPLAWGWAQGGCACAWAVLDKGCLPGPASHSSVLSLSSVCCASRDWSRLAQIVGCSVIIFGHLAAAPSGVWWGLGEQETPGLAWPGTGRGEQGL